MQSLSELSTKNSNGEVTEQSSLKAIHLGAPHIIEKRSYKQLLANTSH